MAAKVADTVAEHLRSGDKAYRYGGEGFLVVLPEQTLESAGAVAERIRRAVENLKITHDAKDPPGVITVSAGVFSLSAGDGSPVSTLLEEADTALYRAKRSGRNRVLRTGQKGGG